MSYIYIKIITLRFAVAWEIAIHRMIEATRDACEEIAVLICSRKRKSEFAEVEGTPVF